MKTRWIVIVAVACMLGLIGWRVVVTKRAAAKPETRADEAVLVQTAPVALTNLDEKVSFTGAIRPKNEVDVFAKVAGRIESLGVKMGERVRAGRVLAVVEHKEIAWQAKAAQAAVEVARANLDGARLEFERTQALLVGGSAAQAQMDGAKVRLALAQAQLAQAEAAAGLARQQLENANVVAPFDGTITRRLVDVGSQVGAQTVLFTLQDVARLKLETSVEAAAFVRLAAGQDVRISVDALPGETFGGKVTLRSPSLDAVTRRAAVEIEIDNASGRLMPNMFVHADATVGHLEDVLALPKGALLEAAGGLTAYRVRGDHVEAVRPTLGASDGAQVVVLAGLAQGDQVVVGGLEGLADGTAVKLGAAKGLEAERAQGRAQGKPAVASRRAHQAASE